MKTNWEDICRKVALELELEEEDVIDQMDSYFQATKIGVSWLEKFKFEFAAIGRLKLRENLTDRWINSEKMKHPKYDDHDFRKFLTKYYNYKKC